MDFLFLLKPEIQDFINSKLNEDIQKLAFNKNPFPEYDQLNLNSLSEAVRLRRLPKRCLEISQSNVTCIEENIDNKCFLLLTKDLK